MISALSATQAYAAVQKIAGAGGDSQAMGGLSGVGDAGGFGDILKAAMSDAVKTSKNAEVQMTNQVNGRADLVDVVTAISSAEASLETVMAVRDQVISAYQEIMRMPI